MVHQRGNPLTGEYFARDNSLHNPERNFLDISQDGRFSSAAHTHLPMPIGTALRQCVGIPVKHWAMIAFLDNGDFKTYQSTKLGPYQSKIFSDKVKQDFSNSVRGASSDRAFVSGIAPDSSFSEFESDNGNDIRNQSSSGGSSSDHSRRRRYPRHSISEESEDGGPLGAKRKRARATRYAESAEDTPVPIPVQRTHQVEIGNLSEVSKLFYIRFKDLQQSACKVMGKAFVKLVEPKKQTNYPYTKGNEMAPPWWPSTTGEHMVRHREPDHLLKPERIRLLVHILLMIVEPYDKQCSAVQKLYLNVKKLEEVTMEAMSNWFNDQEHPENASKKKYLKEIFKIAKAVEKFKNGEIDGSTKYFVMSDGEKGSVDGSEDESGDGVKDEDDDVETISASLPTPDSLVSPQLMQTQQLQPQSDVEPAGAFHGMRAIPVRYHTQQVEDQTNFTDSSCFPRGIGYQSQSPALHDRRTAFPSAAYHSPQQIFNGWQQNSMATNGPLNSAYYVTSPQSNLGSSSAQYQLPPPNQQSMLPPPLSQHHYEGLSSGRFDPGPALGNQFRTGSLGHPHEIPSSGFQDYLHDSNSFGQHESDMHTR